MDVRELKTRIQNNTLDDSILILKYSDSKYLCNHYIDAICKNKNKKKLNIDSLDNFKYSDDIFETVDNYIYVLDTEKLTEEVNSELKNIIIICKEVPNNLSVDFIDIPKLVSWQIEDYIQMRLPGLDENQIKWLCEICKHDIYRLDNECAKLEIFNSAMQKIIFNEINNENGYADLNPSTIFNFTNAFIKKDYNTLNIILSNLESLDIEATGVTTILTKQIKNLIDIQINPKNTATSLNMNPKQFNAIKYNVGKFTNNQLINMYEFLTEIDYKLKSGQLLLDETNEKSVNNNKLVNYITANLITLANC